ncbi:MAG TPA: hypothetical protein VNW97_20605 [Candidatus Saccharimonadales bacterium]|jgi:hypothetical protein|nr:hypothetical protein [Candidatus Saccharimonadales bacterium]
MNDVFPYPAFFLRRVGVLFALRQYLALEDTAGIPPTASIVFAQRWINRHTISTKALIDYGHRLFDAMWTSQEGPGRPLTKGIGMPERAKEPRFLIIEPEKHPDG